MDLESRRRALPGGGANCRSFSRQRATPYALEESVCRLPVRAGVGAKTLRGTRCRSDAGRIETLLSVLATEASHHEEGKAACTYFQEHRHRMRYAQFEAQGLCTSTGVVEAGCKNAIGARLKRSGMHWSVRGAMKVSRFRGRFISAVFVGLDCNTPSVGGEQGFRLPNVNDRRECQGCGH